MSKVCKLSGKKPQVGYNVSHAHNKTKKRWLPNLQKKRIFVPELNRWVRIRLSVKALRTVEKKGLLAYLKSQGLTLKDVT
ncbi:MAG TPA: 50S ribosomal protein L28 [Bacteroidetes bacterium]|nr:50S ribosomal protein L28 [Bacteroidota bacterium]